ncbi:flagellar hook protein FlgE [Microbulbifer thermotolerans]|uniref:Flagellar hook protein FlgE n=1 Tax=Microbulbifer thermotolerans TaxID=252514 RepID=A0A143HNB7_MICTH|nr:flagellar hook protein FlgE [Microbulbifer thermotolerans]AMX03188.1 flagellar biosynthesis protein FlgE [Microbulbifer thermotolerans]MCX2783489.1 flagellar hook protein FlgE [Microbulbifer thermotolerans]MCX2795883.1 flagellar hook protein FlgE [Microbulbifer thermotolerans]MCX2835541.1 flagellar hook protein FlgE [Microbulbifer thermotolerans]WKT59753.1 flagellar hook protein FlgE [Microbulbifer thermotolerans]
MGFSQALSGLNAAATNLDVVGNNIANSATVGFKSSSVQFADVYTGALAGQGTRVSAVLQDFSNGTLESTGRNLDLGINGSGFFRFTQGGEVLYSRNGQLILTSDGYLENAQGARLTGFPAGVGTGGQPEELQVPAGAMPASATTEVEASFNLDATVSIIDRAITPFSVADADSYSYANTGTAYDSLGVQHTMTTYFTKTADNTWEVRVAVDGVDDTVNVGQLIFTSNGTLDVASSTFPTYSFTPAGGADPLNFTIAFDGTTQFGNDFSLDSLSQNGYTSGALVGISFDEDGNIIGNYANEQSQVLGTVALANFRNEEGLTPAGDNVWVESGSSGQPLLGLAGTGQFGTLEPGTVEVSNVDLTRELVDLIVAQRNYQANTQTIKIQDEVLQSAVNLR